MILFETPHLLFYLLKDLHTSVTHIFYHVMSSLSLAQELVTNTYVTICILSFTLLKSGKALLY